MQNLCCSFTPRFVCVRSYHHVYLCGCLEPPTRVQCHVPTCVLIKTTSNRLTVMHCFVQAFVFTSNDKRNTKIARSCLQFYWFCCFWRHGSIAIFRQIFEQLRVVFHLHESVPRRIWRLSRYRWKKLSQSIRVEIYHPKCNHCNQLSREFPAIPTRHHPVSRCRRGIPYSPRLQTQLFWAIHSFFAGVASWRSRVEYAISDACSNAVYTSNENWT